MKPDFTMSMYPSKKELYKAKAEYYEKAFKLIAERMVETEDLGYDRESEEYYCPHSGERMSEMVGQ